MAEIETITFMSYENDAQYPRVPENYTQVSGICGREVTPQFLNAADNVQHPAEEWQKLTQSYARRDELNFFRIR